VCIGLFWGVYRALLSVCRAVRETESMLSGNSALLGVHRIFLGIYGALLSVCRAVRETVSILALATTSLLFASFFIIFHLSF
jgi:succinate-acetate transporter protein